MASSITDLDIKSFLDDVMKYENGFASKILFLAMIIYFGMFLTIAIVQVLKNTNYLFKMRTEKLSMFVSMLVYGGMYLVFIFGLKYSFQAWELVVTLITGLIMGNISSLVAEKMFKIKK